MKLENNDAVRINVTDKSENGRIWRLSTPEFNHLEILNNGYDLISPKGAKMKVRVPADKIPGKIRMSKIRYGGSTTKHNRGTGFGNKFWLYNMVIDVSCYGNIILTLELQEEM